MSVAAACPAACEEGDPLEFHLFSVLALGQAGAADGRTTRRARIVRHIARIAAWDAGRPPCLAGMLALAQGALHEFDGDETAALACFERAAGEAAHGGEHIAVLARERAAALNARRHGRIAEKALRESRATLLLGERINRSGSWSWHLGTDKVNCSAELCRIFEFDRPDAPPSASLDAPMNTPLDAPMNTPMNAPADPQGGRQVTFDALMGRIHPHDRAGVARVLGRAVAARRPVRFELRVVRADGGIRYLAVVGQPMGEADAYVGTASDVTRRRIDEEALRKAQARLVQGARMTTVGQLTAAIAHEVNQPLMAISSNGGAGLRWLRRDPPRLDQVARLLQDIVAQSQRAGKIIQTLQALGHKRPRFGGVDLHALVRDTLRLARGTLDRHEIALELELRAPHGRIEGDAVQLQQVLVNLVDNAVESLARVHGQAPEQGPEQERRRLLRIRTGPGAGSGIEVRVEDNGGGVDAAGLDAMFEPFVSTKPDGIGIGLAVCRSIIEAHGGAIRAEAASPHGCSVVFSLPGAQP
jgi:signal transduction histidine kinase